MGHGKIVDIENYDIQNGPFCVHFEQYTTHITL